VPLGTKLTVINNDVIVRQAGQVIDSVDIKGQLLIEASNVTVKRSIVEGRPGGTSVVVVSGSGSVFTDDEITVATTGPTTDDMNLSNATVMRSNIHGGVDGIKIHGTGVITANYIHGLTYFAVDPAKNGGPTHNDSVQILSSSNIRVIGNTLASVAQDNSAIQVTQSVGAVSNLTISGNWADGGGCTFNFSSHNGAGTEIGMSGISVTNNRFGHTSRLGCAIVRDLKTTLSASGNVYDNNNAPVVIIASN
jgi:hypothetical protein